MITPRQCVAARALLKWHQEDLAQRCGVSRSALAKFEAEITGIAGAQKLQSIQEAFEAAGIQFIGKLGLEFKETFNLVLEGANSIVSLLDDIYYSTNSGEEILIWGVDEAKHMGIDPDNLKAHMARLRSKGISERLLSCQGDANFLMPRHFYRWIPKEYFDNTALWYIYADKLAIVRWEPLSVSIYKDANLSGSYRKQFEFMWQSAIIPDDEALE